TITWGTDEPSDSQVEYWTSGSDANSTDLSTQLVTSHSQTLYGLAAGTIYFFHVKSRDAAGNLAVSADQPLTTTTQGTTGFVHPGGFHTIAQIQQTRAQVLAGAQPWAAAFPVMLGEADHALGRTPSAVPWLNFLDGGDPNFWTLRELLEGDATAAYYAA